MWSRYQGTNHLILVLVSVSHHCILFKHCTFLCFSRLDFVLSYFMKINGEAFILWWNLLDFTVSALMRGKARRRVMPGLKQWIWWERDKNQTPPLHSAYHSEESSRKSRRCCKIFLWYLEELLLFFYYNFNKLRKHKSSRDKTSPQSFNICTEGVAASHQLEGLIVVSIKFQKLCLHIVERHCATI